MGDRKFLIFLNYMAGVIVAICIIGIVYGSVIYLTQSRNVQKYQIVLTVSPDSIYNDNKFSYYTDSLIQVINRHEHILEDRYDAILEEKYNTQQYWTIAGILTTIVISILGFFGYKSFKDIESKCVEISKATTADIVQESLLSIVKSEMSNSDFSSKIIAAVSKEIDNSKLANIENRLSVLEDSVVANASPSDSNSTEHVPEIPQLPDNPEEDPV